MFKMLKKIFIYLLFLTRTFTFPAKGNDVKPSDVDEAEVKKELLRYAKYLDKIPNDVDRAEFKAVLAGIVRRAVLADLLLEERGRLRNEKEQVSKDAELSEFLLYLCEQIAQFEKNYCVGLPSKDNYIKAIANLAKISPSQISNDIHFRRWLWILLDRDETRSDGIVKLRTALNKDPNRYLWFANQMKIMYSVICEDVHGKSPLEIRHMKKANFPHYLTFFTEDIRLAVQQFLECVL